MPGYNRVILVKRTHDYQSFGRLETGGKADAVHEHIIRRLKAWGVKYLEVEAKTPIEEVLGMLE
jgi:hypothetical protein